MIRNFIKSAIRNLFRNKTFTFLNIGGLMFGMGASLVVFSYINYQKGFNSYNSNIDNVYRIVFDITQNGNEYHTWTVPHPFGKALREEGLVDHISRMFNHGEAQINVNEHGQLKKYKQDKIAFAENEIFEILDMQWVMGKPDISAPNTAVISETAAKKIFGDRYLEAINKEININNVHDLLITAIYKDLPEQCDFRFKMLINYDTQEGVNEYFGKGEIWERFNGGTGALLLLPDNVSVKQLENQIAQYFQKRTSKDQFFARLQPLSEVHYDSAYGTPMGITFPEEASFTLLIIGLLLIVVSGINFINLSTAKASNRAKEVGIRKVLGSLKGQLIIQHLTETFILVLISLLGALAVSELLFKWISPIVGSELSLIELPLSWLIPVVALFVMGVTLFTGIYPAIIISSFSTVQALKSSIHSSGKGGKVSLRRILVIAQFAISMALIIGTIVSLKQNSFLLNKELGFQKNGIISVMLPEVDEKNTEFLKNELSGISEVKVVSAHLGSPIARTKNTDQIIYKEDEKEQLINVNFKEIDENYLDLFEIKLLAGKPIEKSDPEKYVVVTRGFTKKMGIQNPQEAIGKIIDTEYRRTFQIKGVVEDFHESSFRSEMTPVLLHYQSSAFYELAIKLEHVNQKSIERTLASLEDSWNTVYPEHLIEYDFLDDMIQSQYEAETRAGKLLRFFALLAVIIGALGLYGLIDFIAIKRTKEIGIRKVLGASTPSIMNIFMKEILTAVTVSLLIAGPLMYFLLNMWLEMYAYRTSIDWSVFVIAFLSVVILSAVTVGYRSIKASNLNPVETLKDE